MNIRKFFSKKSEPLNLADLQNRKSSIRASYDIAQTSSNNKNHWQWTDSLSADAALNSSVRKTIRERARYEKANNSFAKGIVQSLAYYLVGTGPRLQMQTEEKKINQKIEDGFASWCRAVNLARHLQLAKITKTVDGESFIQFITNPKLKHQVKLDLRPVEAEMITAPFLSADDPDEVDGIKFDSYGNPVSYKVLKDHPGTDKWKAQPLQYTIVPASQMIHWFRQDRPGQHRGVSELSASLSLYSQMRRYTLAVLDAAETAANISGVIQADVPSGEDADDIDALAEISLARNVFTTMPYGWKLGQLKAEQPTTTHREFKETLINEAGRGNNVPFNVASGNSSGYNYASGRLDHQDFFKSVSVERNELEIVGVDHIFYEWLKEFTLANNIRLSDPYPRHSWFWDGVPHVDPLKEANAQKTRLANNTTTLAEEFARDGKDWEVEIRQRAREKELMKELGLNNEDLSNEQRRTDTE